MMSGAVIMAWRLQTYMYLEFSVLAILVYDYCITLGTEVRCIWDRSWTFVRVLFLVARYVPFILVPMFIYYTFGSSFMNDCPLFGDGTLCQTVNCER
ncbi:hypothetical protein BJ138DRAFT_1158377 [Hygrophoropsis aurantiaca]|uniref:Uncharacterized protein n=1 Tax=Hygrophoropsis aurantiaca TaxID=72124 RepID=A0ACB8A4M2_9AGAM|nr:hypothetical protein BJ138DRAFT_1158377 [Hygrophoropsis aurantiaca]